VGLILDSSVLVAAERKCLNARQALSKIAQLAAGEDVAVSVVTLIELAHGESRADTPGRKATRRQFIHELITAVPVHAVTVRWLCEPDRSTGRTALRASVWLLQTC
jgi:predicted nucleic acid-binding protein